MTGLVELVERCEARGGAETMRIRVVVDEVKNSADGGCSLTLKTVDSASWKKDYRGFACIPVNPMSIAHWQFDKVYVLELHDMPIGDTPSGEEGA